MIRRASSGPRDVRRARASWLGLVALAAACGSRTGLDLGAGVGPSQPAQGFDAGCPQAPWLLFDVMEHEGPIYLRIYATHADGTGGHFVILPHDHAAFPSVSPDGTKLLYATALPPDAGGGPDVDSALYVYDFASHSDSLVVTTSQLTYSALSPDGRFVSYVSGYTLRAIGSDGSNDHALLSGPSDQGSGYGHPTFAADSRTVLYGTGGEVGAIEVDGSGDRNLLDAIPGSFQYPNPAFSPDYQRIVVGAFCSQTSPYALRIYAYSSLPGTTCDSGQLLVDVNDGASFNLANDPSWGPDGRIAYASGKDVWIIEATGGTPTSLTAALTADGGTVQAADPVWVPGCADVP